MSDSTEPSTETVQETSVEKTAADVFENTGDTDEQCLSSNLYKDFSGIDTESFILTTLKNNPKDRTLLLTLEKVFQDFIHNEEQTSHQFQAMNSYERMIVHRVAAFFGLDHNVDKNGQSIIVTKTANTRIPNLAFETIIPTEEANNGANTIANESNSRRSTTLRNNNHHKYSNQQIFQLNKPSAVDRANYSNKFHRKQPRFHSQQTNMQSTSQSINPRSKKRARGFLRSLHRSKIFIDQPMYPSISTSYYPQQSIEHDYKQQTTNSPMYNYVPMISHNSYQHGANHPVPILLHQQPSGQIQYVFPTQQPISSDGQYMPIYRSDGVPSAIDNNLYPPSPYVHLYPTHPYPPPPQSAPSFLIPSGNPSSSIQYATNQLAALNLQSQYDSNTRLLPSTSSNKPFQSNRPIRPMNSNPTDKPPISSVENETKSSD